MADAADHGQSRARWAAQGGLGIRPPDRPVHSRGLGSDPDRAARRARGRRRARARRAAAACRRHARPGGGCASRAGCRGSCVRRGPRRKPRSQGSSRFPCGTSAKRPRTSAASASPSPGSSRTAGRLRSPSSTWPTSAGRSGLVERSRSQPQEGTTCSSPALPAPARRCSPAAYRGFCPSLSTAEALEVTRIHSVAGLLAADRPLITTRPLRSPHYSASVAALVGGGPAPRPGEVSLAHRGVLVLDEFAEFQRPALEALRQPLEDGVVSIARVGGRAVFPARFQLVAAMNLCPCGARGDPAVDCKCSPQRLSAYRDKLSRALLDRFDLIVAMPRPRAAELAAPPGEASDPVRHRVAAARRSTRVGPSRMDEGGGRAPRSRCGASPALGTGPCAGASRRRDDRRARRRGCGRRGAPRGSACLSLAYRAGRTLSDLALAAFAAANDAHLVRAPRDRAFRTFAPGLRRGRVFGWASRAGHRVDRTRRPTLPTASRGDSRPARRAVRPRGRRPRGAAWADCRCGGCAGVLAIRFARGADARTRAGRCGAGRGERARARRRRRGAPRRARGGRYDGRGARLWDRPRLPGRSPGAGWHASGRAASSSPSTRRESSPHPGGSRHGTA